MEAECSVACLLATVLAMGLLHTDAIPDRPLLSCGFPAQLTFHSFLIQRLIAYPRP